MKRFILIELIVCISNMLKSQCINSYPILTTDPVVTIQQRNIQGKINSWDWTREIYDDVYVTQDPNGNNPICTIIRAPWHFDEMSNPNVE